MPSHAGTRPGHRLEHGLFVREWGAGSSGAPLLFVHGLGESGLCFEALAGDRRLAGRRRLVPDLPGYGRTPWPPEPLGLAETADRLAGWMGAAEIGPSIVVGHSMGAVVALLLAERHPERVAAMIDVEGNKSLGDCVFSLEATRMDRDAFEHGGFDAVRERVYRDGVDDQALRTYYPSLCLCDARTFHANGRELVRMSEAEDLAPRLAALPVPVVFIAGRPRGVCEKTLGLLDAAGVRVVELAPSGHWPFLDRADEFADLLASLVAEPALAGV